MHRKVRNVAGGNQYSYEIDPKDRIAECSENWDEFALANDGPHVVSGKIRNSSVWDHIHGETTIGLYRRIFKNAREGRPVQFFLRCDSPAVRRLLLISISPTISSNIRVKSLVFRSDERHPPCELLIRAEGETVHTMCTWCNKIDVDGWYEVEDVARKMERPPEVSYGICPVCEERIERQLRVASDWGSSV